MESCLATIRACNPAPAMLCIRRGVLGAPPPYTYSHRPDRYVGTLSQHMQPSTHFSGLASRARRSESMSASIHHELPHPSHPSASITSTCSPGVLYIVPLAILFDSDDAASTCNRSVPSCRCLPPPPPPLAESRCGFWKAGIGAQTTGCVTRGGFRRALLAIYHMAQDRQAPHSIKSREPCRCCATRAALVVGTPSTPFKTPAKKTLGTEYSDISLPALKIQMENF